MVDEAGEAVMGEAADEMLAGLLCQRCGAYIPGKAPGHPRSCDNCKKEDKPAAPKKRKRRKR